MSILAYVCGRNRKLWVVRNFGPRLGGIFSDRRYSAAAISPETASRKIVEKLEYYVYLQLLELDWCTRSKTNVSNLFMRSCTSTPGALPASAGDKPEAGILMKAQEDPSPRLEQLLHGYLRSQRILANLVRDGSWLLARFHRLAINSGTGTTPHAQQKISTSHLLALSACMAAKLRFIPPS